MEIQGTRLKAHLHFTIGALRFSVVNLFIHKSPSQEIREVEFVLVFNFYGTVTKVLECKLFNTLYMSIEVIINLVNIIY